jgi:hypothetical protein
MYFPLKFFKKEKFMKKISVILAVLVILVFAGCASSGGGGGAASGAAPYSVDLSKLRAVTLGAGDAVGEPTGLSVRNRNAFTKNYDDLFLLFPSDMPDVTGYARITIKCKYFNADNEEINQGDSNAMVVLVYDINGDKRGPEMGAGPNTPLKEFNVGGFSGQVSTDRGVRLNLRQNPGAILFQNSNTNVKFIEVTEITFHN